MIEILKKDFSGNTYTALRFATLDFDLPSHLMQATRKECMLITDEGIRAFPWKGVIKDREGMYLLLPECCIESIWSIASTNRKNALDIVRKIAEGILRGGKDFSSTTTGIFPLSRIYIMNGSDVLLLPPDAEEILAVSMTQEDRARHIRSLVRKGNESGYTLISEMVQLLYYAVTSRLPYEMEEVRRSGYTEPALELYEGDIPPELSSYISTHLSLRESRQRKIGGNAGAESALSYFLSSSASLVWPFRDRSGEEAERERDEAESKTQFVTLWNEKVKKASRRRFWREKGAIVAAVAFAVAVVSYFAGHYLHETFRAPYTRDLDPEGIILDLYEKQNRLDANEISEGFRKNPPQYIEVVNLYVSSTTRKVYESLDAFMSPEEWIDGGRGAIPASTSIYGVIVESVENTGDDRWLAVGDWYSPTPFDERDEDMYEARDGMERIFVYSVEQDFLFQWNKRGWWVCQESDILSYTLKEVLYVPFRI